MLTRSCKVFIRPLRNVDPPVIQGGVDRFIDQVFGNILDLRERNRHLLEAMYIRQREQDGIISKIGDIFLNAAIEFRFAYPTYIGRLAAAERRLEEEMERNEEFKGFLEVCVRFSWTYYRTLETDPVVSFLKQRSRHPDTNTMDLKHWLNRPLEHLNIYPVFFEAIPEEAAAGGSDVNFLKEAVEAMRNLQLKTYQAAMGKGPTGSFEWHDLVPRDVRSGIPKQVAKRQA